MPDDTPQNFDRYEEIQNIFLNEAEKRDIEPRELDYQIWKNRATDGYSIEDSVK